MIIDYWFPDDFMCDTHTIPVEILHTSEIGQLSLKFRNVHYIAKYNKPFREYGQLCKLNQAKGFDVGTVSYFIWQDLIDNLYIYIYIYRCLYIYRFFTDGYIYIYVIELRKIGCLFSFSYVLDLNLISIIVY
jgi:hypothetical protein